MHSKRNNPYADLTDVYNEELSTSKITRGKTDVRIPFDADESIGLRGEHLNSKSFERDTDSRVFYTPNR